MHPFTSSYIDYSAIVPAFSRSCSYIQLDALLIGISFTEKSEALETVCGIITNGNDSGPIGVGIDHIPE